MVYGGILGVACFTFVSANFLIESSRIKTEKILKIVLETIFYSMIIGIVLDKLELVHFGMKEVVKSLLTIITGEYWYISSYIMLYILHPFLNDFIKNSSKEKLKLLVIILSIIILLWRMIYNKADISGLDILVTMYLFMGLLKKQDNNWFERNRYKGFLITTILVYVLTVGINILGTILDSNIILENSKFFVTRSSILLILDGAFLFYIFKNLKIKNNKIINTLASSSLGVYIIHESRFMKSILYDTVLNVGYFFEKWYFVFYMVLVVISIYIIAVLIDLLRQKGEKAIFNQRSILSKICQKIDKLINIWLFKYSKV